MNALAKASLGFLTAALLIAVPTGIMAAAQSPPTTANPTPMLFGMDSAAIAAETAAGVKPDYGTLWIGPWTLTSGWGGPDGQLDAMRNAGVTPAIHFYYWGDDISQSCLENGCWSSLHNTQKDKAHWQTLADQLVTHLNSKLQGKPALIFLETEFNKGNVATYEPLDGYLAEKATQIHQGYPAAKVVMSLGNWNSAAWPTWDRTAAASDYTGIQGMRGSTRQSATDYATLYEGVLAGAKTLKADFGKPIILQDIALSTYPEPDYLARQADELHQFFTSMGDLQAQGVQGLLYRSWKDSPNMDTANYYGEAERHWGLAWAGNGTEKSGGQVWTEGVKAVRAAGANHPPVAALAATASGLTVSVDGSGSSDPDGQALTYAWTFGDGATGTGKTASHAYAAAGTYAIGLTVSDGSLSASASGSIAASKPNAAPTAAFSASASQLTASLDASTSSDPDGDALSYAWTFGDGSTGSGKTASHTFAAAGTYTLGLTVSDSKASSSATHAVTVSKATYTAAFTTQSASNEDWVQEKVSSNPAPAKVEIQVSGGSWQALKLQSYGDWTLGTHVAKGTSVVFRASAPDGQAVTTGSQSWLGSASSTSSTTTTTTSASATSTTSASKTTTTTSVSKSTTTAPPTTTATAFSAKFTPKSVGNDWWVETAVSANQPVAKVEAKVGSNGAWTVLAKQDWGNYAKSVNAPNGSYVQFRATSGNGAVATSATYVWG